MYSTVCTSNYFFNDNILTFLSVYSFKTHKTLWLSNTGWSYKHQFWTFKQLMTAFWCWLLEWSDCWLLEWSDFWGKELATWQVVCNIAIGPPFLLTFILKRSQKCENVFEACAFFVEKKSKIEEKFQKKNLFFLAVVLWKEIYLQIVKKILIFNVLWFFEKHNFALGQIRRFYGI